MVYKVMNTNGKTNWELWSIHISKDYFLVIEKK